MRDERLFLITWSYDSSWTVVKGGQALAELLEPYIEETIAQNALGAARGKLAKAAIRGVIEGTLKPVQASYRGGNQIAAVKRFSFDTGEARLPLEGEVANPDRNNRLGYYTYIERVSAVYQLPTEEPVRPGPRR